jgi:purine-binding chemotaxis protein CheW
MIRPKEKRIDWDAVKEKMLAARTALEGTTADHDARLKEKFRQRAERLAAPLTNTRSTAETFPVLAFTVDAETYGIELRCVAQVFPDTTITPVPGSPRTCLGIANLQGEVRSVLGIRRLLSLSDDDGETNHYILLLRRDGLKVGLRVEQIEDVRQVAHDSVTGTENVGDQSTRCVRGLTRENLILLNTDAFL